MASAPTKLLFGSLILTTATTLTLVSARAQYYTGLTAKPAEPYFIEEPENVTTRLGQRIVLGCRVGNINENTSVQWTRDSFGLGPKDGLEVWKNLRILDTNPETDWNLEISPVSLEDDAEFQCQVAQLRSRSSFVTVWVPPEDPEILQGSVVEVKENVEVSLQCESKGGKPAAKVHWYDHHENLINDAAYESHRMSNSKLFSAKSTVTFIPTKDHHNVTWKCTAWNEAANNLRPASVRLQVLYAPSVTVTPVRPGMVLEGQEAIFRCTATANPPVYENKYRWYIDDKLITGQFGFYFKIQNVTRAYHDKHVVCQVENELGMASGPRTIEVRYGPTMVIHPQSTYSDRLSMVTLYCAVDSNPSPKYYWTRGTSREIISSEQNLTLTVSEDTVDTYFCHVDVDGFPSLTSRQAELLMTGVPKITSQKYQTGTIGENVHINCAAISIPEAREVHWKYHGSTIDDGNPHYRVINSPIEHGLRSTLIIRQALPTDFGPYTCSLKNSHGAASFEIELQEEQPLPLQFILICVFAVIIFFILLSFVTIMYRRRACCSASQKTKKSNSSTSLDLRSGVNNGALVAANNAIMKVNNLDQLSYNSTDIKRDLHSPTVSNEVDSIRDGSDNQDGFYRCNNNSSMNCGNPMYHNTSEMDVEFPPKPDVISGYVPNSNFVRDLYPPGLVPGQESPLYGPGNSNTYNPNNSRQSSLLNVSDPRYSATYGNPYLRHTGPRNMQYSTFCPTPPCSVINPCLTATTTFSATNNPLGASTSSNTLSSGLSTAGVPITSMNQIPVSSSTPNSSISNMACLPEDGIVNNGDLAPPHGISVLPLHNATPSPPPPPAPMTTQQVPIYVKLNGFRQTSSPRVETSTSPNPSTDLKNSQNFPMHYTGNGSLPRHALPQSFAFKSDQSSNTGGLATRV